MDTVSLLILYAFVNGAASQSHGPVFLQEPPSHLTFSNTTGSQVSCSAHGSPNPQVDWLVQDGQTVTAVPGLRQSLGNGTLYFPPFRGEDYRKDVHSTVYRCRASNIAGTILSRDVNVRAVVNQPYEVQVYHTHVLAGNTAILLCVIPSFVKEHVTVTSWSRDDSILLPGSNMGGRIVVTYGTGELHIRSARSEDGMFRYSCLTIHSLTQERKRSAPAILTVTEPTGSMPPRLAASVQTVASADRETDIHLTCSAQGNPPPTFNWFRETNGHLQSVFSSSRFEPLQDVLLIRALKPDDSGKWVCKSSNQFGEQRLDIHLTVTAHLSLHVLPQLQIVNSGENAVFNCSISGSPVGHSYWLRNGELLSVDENPRIRLLSPLVLAISGVTRYDRGMYQCVARNDRESAQGSAELRLGDTVPELQYTFIEQALRPGPQVSLRCSATGSPPPQFQWMLDGEFLSEHNHRYAIGQYVDQAGDVVSHLNISNVRVEDGGLYSCRASNSLGSAEHSARLNIYGPLLIRAIGPVKAVAGSDVTLHCPYSGYPIGSVRWKRQGQDLPIDLRHRLEERGSLTILRLDPSVDSDIYTCFVSGRNGDVVHRNIQLVVRSPPILEPFSFPASLQEGGRAQVTCYVTSGDMPIHFAWYKDNIPISANLQVEERAAEFYSMLIFKEVSSKHSGGYTCVASNSAARANYTANLMVKVAPQWLVEPQDVSTLLGNSVLVGCSAKGFPRPQITWLKAQGKASNDFQPLMNQHGQVTLLPNGSLWLGSVSAQEEGQYLCRATNGIGSGIGKVIHLDVNEPVRFNSQMRNISAKRGSPVVLACQVFGDTPIDIIWFHNGNRLDINSYRITVKETNGDNEEQSQVTINRTDREDSGVYKCQAQNAYGRSEHLINLAVQERPDPPGFLEVVEVSSRSVRLAWRRSFDGNSPILGYLVQYQPLGIEHVDWENAGTQNLTLPAISTTISDDNLRESAIIGGLLPATAYKIRMLAVNSIDQSSFTEDVVVKTQEEEPSEAPQDVRIDAVGAGELFLSWRVPPRESWNGELLGYIVSWNEQGKLSNNTKTLTVKGWATTKVQLTGLRKFTRYDIALRAFNSVSVGPQSPTVLGITKEGVPEAAPLDITCSQISSQSMKVLWSAPPLSKHGGIIQGYKVYYRPILLENIEIPATGEIKRTPSTETYLHSLHKYTNYSIKVLAYTGAGDGVISPPIFCTTEEDVPGPPANIKAASLTGESILVSWLAPKKPNGRISHYTIYAREAGRVGKHISYTLRIEDTIHAHGLTYEVRNLVEEKLYEFWVSATTSIGEGEPTAIVSQSPKSRAPSRIASFSQVLQKAVKNRVLLPCLAAGNPTPRTRWIHRERPITFSNYYEVTTEGHLNIHSVDYSLAGNYTCSAKNLFGEDEITYTLIVVLPPNAPVIDVQYTTSKNIRLHWSQPKDGGALIQGYTLNYKRDGGSWSSLELSPEQTVYTFDDLHCGSVYHIYISASNKVGIGNPSPVLTTRTKGGPPQLPKESDFISTNATTLQLNLYNWPDGGCSIFQFSIMYRPLTSDKWILVSSSVSSEKLIVQDLRPATWYQLKVRAENDAGHSNGLFNFATTTIAGERIPPPTSLLTENSTSAHIFKYKEIYTIMPMILLSVLLIFTGRVCYRRYRQRGDPESGENQEDGNQQDQKIAERDNRRNCQQVYTSSPVKTGDKIPDDVSGMYEISPYATFSVPGNHNRSVTTSTLDYTMQFKTFGHIEDEGSNAIIYPKHGSGKHSWHKHRYYNTEGAQQQTRLSTTRIHNPVDSESDETSGSPSGDCPTTSNYRVPVKHQREIFRPDSSTESNEVSPMAERRHIPRQISMSRHHRTASSSSAEHEHGEGSTSSGVCLEPPTGFSDGRGFVETDRQEKNATTEKFSSELATHIAGYLERRKEEIKEFTIHV